MAVWVSCEDADGLILASYEQVSEFIVRYRPHRLGHLYRLLTNPVFPDFDRAVVATRHNFTGFKGGNSEHKAVVALIVHEMGAVKTPQLYCLVV